MTYFWMFFKSFLLCGAFVLVLILSGCATTQQVVTPCIPPAVPSIPYYPVFKLTKASPDDQTVMAYVESFTMCRAHADNLEALLKALNK